MPGTKRKRGKDSWYLEVTIGTDFRGKPNRYNRTVHCKSEKQAEKELARFYTECESGKINKQDSTKLSALADTWFTEYAERFYKKSALSSNRTAKDVWVVPVLGDKKVSKLSRMDVQNWINHLADKGLSPKTVRNYYSTLRSMLDFAVDMGIIEDTPCRNVRLPKKERHEAKYYVAEDVARLIGALDTLGPDDLKFRVAVLLFLFSGIRKAELLGLNWEDVDFEGNAIHVHRERLIGRGIGIYEDTPKTAKSARYIKLPAEVMRELRRLRTQQNKRRLALGNKYGDSPAVFCNDTGQPLYPQVLQRWFSRFTDSAGLPHLGLHGLRHTHTSMLSNMKVDAKQISERLGHSQLSTTLNIYTHLFEDTGQQIADELSEKYLSAK